MAEKSVNESLAMYNEAPELRKGYYIQDWGVIASIAALPLWAFTYFTRSLLGCALSLTILGPVLIYIGWLKQYRAKKLGVSGDISCKTKCNGLPWFDPYGLARDAVDVPGKKTYFVVDSERNAVVDVIHLGKWGQKWLNHRAKRQAAEATE